MLPQGPLVCIAALVPFEHLVHFHLVFVGQPLELLDEASQFTVVVRFARDRPAVSFLPTLAIRPNRIMLFQRVFDRQNHRHCFNVKLLLQ